MDSLLEAGEHSDFVISCRHDTYKVHKSIIRSQSDFFDAATRFGKEAEEGKIHLHEDNPEVVKYMIQYMYELDYHLPSESAKRPWWIRIDWSGRSNSYITNTAAERHNANADIWLYYTQISDTLLKDPSIISELNKMAMFSEFKRRRGLHARQKATDDVLELDPSNLQNTALVRYMDHLCNEAKKDESSKQRHPPNHQDAATHAEVYSIADKYDVKGLREIAADKFQDSLRNIFPGKHFFEAVSIAFTTTPDSDITLREIVAKHVYQMKGKYGMFEELEDNLQSVPGLSYHVLRYEYSLLQDNPTKDTESQRRIDPVALIISLSDFERQLLL